MIAEFLLPDVERTRLRARTDEVEIADHKLEHGGQEIFVQVRMRAAPPRERKDFKRWPVILGTRPTGEIERSVWVDAGLSQH